MGKRLKKIRKAVGKRLKKRANNMIGMVHRQSAMLRRIERIEKFLEPDLSEFHEKQKIAADPLAATVGTG